MNKKGDPTVDATDDGCNYLVACPYCDECHSHGRVEGHRIAHCKEGGGHGYYLRLIHSVPLTSNMEILH